MSRIGKLITVSQLIEYLKTEDQGAAVVVEGREGGYSHIHSMYGIQLIHDPVPREGDYREANVWDDEGKRTTAVVLARKRL